MRFFIAAFALVGLVAAVNNDLEPSAVDQVVDVPAATPTEFAPHQDYECTGSEEEGNLICEPAAGLHFFQGASS